MERRIALATALALSLGGAAQAQPAVRCTHETLNVRGTPLAATYCVSGAATAAPGRDLPIRVSERFSTAHGSVSQDATLQFIAGEEASRTIQDLPLERLGMQGVLHLTLLLQGGTVRVDSAMLTPGAITVK